MKFSEKQASGIALLAVATPFLIASLLLGFSETEFGSTHIYWAPCPTSRCVVNVAKGLSQTWFGMVIIISLAEGWGLSMISDRRIEPFDWGEPTR